jgi:hypothetical protein
LFIFTHRCDIHEVGKRGRKEAGKFLGHNPKIRSAWELLCYDSSTHSGYLWVPLPVDEIKVRPDYLLCIKLHKMNTSSLTQFYHPESFFSCFSRSKKKTFYF